MNETSKLRLDFGSNGAVDVPALPIAVSRATYYAKKEAEHCNEDYDKTYQEELAYSLSSKAALWDWFQNNMSWSEVESAVTVVRKPEALDYERLLCEGDVDIEFIQE